MAIHTFRITAAVLVLMLYFRTGSSYILVSPNNSEVQMGGSTHFNCTTSTTSEDIQWFHYAVSKQDRSFVYSYGGFQSPYLNRFTLEKNATIGEYNLVITSVVAGDAGKYECQDEAGRGMKQSAQLVILDGDLVCQSNVDVHKVIGPNACGIDPDQQLVLSCVAPYHGDEAPILQWRLNDSKTPMNKGMTPNINNNRVTYNLTMKGDEITNGAVYVCQTTRSATNISCNSGEVKVVGSTQTQGASDGDGNCSWCTPAIVCLIILLLLLVIAVVGLTLRIRDDWRNKITGFFRRKKQKKKENEEPGTAEEMTNLNLMTSPQDENNETDEAKNQKTVGSANVPTNEDNQKHESDVEAANAKIPLMDKQPVICLEKPSKVTASDVKKLQQEINGLNDRVSRRDATIKTLKEDIQQSGDLINELMEENKSMKARLNHLEQHLYPTETIDYTETPKLAYTVQLSGNTEDKADRHINGIAVLGNELFVVTEKSHELQVYDSKTFGPVGNFKIKEISDPLDMASSKVGNCLYIIARLSDATDSKVIRLDPKGNILKQWMTIGANGRLSTYESNVIVCLVDKQVIIEYSPEGERIFAIPLSPAEKLNHPLHAIKVTSTHFVVSHGDITDKMHRVCVVDSDGKVKKVCSELEKSNFKPYENMKVPICLLEDNERSIIVADRDNGQILLLNAQLQLQRKLIDKAHGLTGIPVRLCFDETNSKLFVAVTISKGGVLKKATEEYRILIFNVK